jgi:hypothetical protein
MNDEARVSNEVLKPCNPILSHKILKSLGFVVQQLSFHAKLLSFVRDKQSKNLKKLFQKTF